MSSESTQIRQVAWQAEIDEYQEVVLSVVRVYDSEGGEVLNTHDDLRLQVRPKPSLQYERLLKSVEIGSGSPAGELQYRDIEIRADDSRRRIWFVDAAAERVVATLDRDTHVTTGPDDESPSWATIDGGVLLDVGGQ
jgi:hypothetical protein